MKVKYKDREIEADEVETVAFTEPWNEYQLANGKVLKLKTVLTRVCRALDEKKDNGEDLYLIQSQQVFRVY